MKEQLIKALLKPEITVEDKYKLIEDLNALQEEKDKIKTILNNIDYFLSDIYEKNVFDEVSLDTGDYKEFRSEISSLKAIIRTVQHNVKTEQKVIDLSKQLADLQSKNQRLIDKNNNLIEGYNNIKESNLKLENEVIFQKKKIDDSNNARKDNYFSNKKEIDELLKELEEEISGYKSLKECEYFGHLLDEEEFEENTKKIEDRLTEIFSTL